jgi:hypothetical protein
MSKNIILLYKKDKNNFEEMLKNNLVNPKVLMEQNNNGETVLHHLIKSNDNKCVENVLNFVKSNFSRSDKQKFIDTQDENGNTALHLATQNRLFDLATLLDIYGANKKIPNNNNEIIDIDTEFTDSSEQINCGDKQKINKLINNIIKPTKDYNEYSQNMSEQWSASSDINLDKILNQRDTNQIQKLPNFTEEWPKTLDDIADDEEKNKKNNSESELDIKLEELILSESSKKIKKTKKVNTKLTESTESSLEDIIISEDSSKKKNKKNFITNFFDNLFNKKQKGGHRSESIDSTSLNLNDTNTMSEFETSEFLKYIDNKINQQGGKKNKKSNKKSKSKKSKSRNIKSLSKSSISSFSSKSSDSSFSSKSSNSSSSSKLSNSSESSTISNLDMMSLSSFNYLETEHIFEKSANLKGGRSKKYKKSKKSKGSKKSKYSASREFSKADSIHQEVIKMIQDLGYSEQEARIIKAGLYSYTKDKHPELSNYDRAVKMRSYATQQHIANLDINAIRQAIETHFANKKKDTDKSIL